MSPCRYAFTYIEVFLKKLSLEHFRCYESLEQSFNETITLIDGDNGSGKTALIEAIYWQSTGRSFRHPKSADLIQHSQKELTVFSEYQRSHNSTVDKLGVSYAVNNKKRIKCNGEIIQRQTDIAQQFPVIAIDPNAFLWVDHAPSFRRSYLDWLVFHVKPDYLMIWKKTQKLQQHLNKLLKRELLQDVPLWQEQYAQLAHQVHLLRQQVVDQIQVRFSALAQQFLPTLTDLTLRYHKGWRGEDLHQELNEKHKHHLKQGFITVGIHKADLQCLVNQQPAQVVLSRGQKKMLAVIMYLVFIEIFEHVKPQTAVICLDDIDSELDNRAIALLSDYLQEQKRQLFITTVHAETVQPYFSQCEVFHVKQNRHNNATLHSA